MKILTAQVHPCLKGAFENHQAEHPEFTEHSATRLLQSVIEQRLIQEVVNYELQAANGNNLYESPFWTSRGMVLIASPALVLAVDKVPPAPSNSLSSISQDAVVATLDEGVVYERFAMPSDIRLDVLDKNKRLAPIEQATLVPGQPLVIDADRHVYDFYSEQDDRFLIKAMSPVKQDFTWSFDRASLLAWNISSANQIDDQVLTALEALACLGDSKVVPTVEGFLSAKSHHVRWKALQVLNELAPERALKAFEAFLNDPHPHIRAAAMKAMD